LKLQRKIELRRINDPAERRELMLHSGDVIVMSGPTQRFWHHQIPKTSKPVDQRINLTFRRITGS
jgi:alkylated DNA repair dioxygenase AlkB